MKANNKRKKLVEEVMKNRKSIRKVIVSVVMLSLVNRGVEIKDLFS